MNTTKTILAGLALAGVLLLPAATRAQDAAPDASNQVESLINGYSSGVTNIKKASDGSIRSLVVIGRAPMNRALPSAQAERFAFRSAQAQARAAFVLWMKTAVSAKYSEKTGVALYIKGEAAGDTGDATSLSTSESSTLSEEEIVEAAKGFVTGLQEIGSGVARNQAVVVFGWNAETARGIDAVADIMDRADQSGTGAGAAKVAREAEERKAAERQQAEEKAAPRRQGGNNAPVREGFSVTNDAADFF